MKLLPILVLSTVMFSAQTLAFGDLLNSDESSDFINKVNETVSEASSSPLADLLSSELDVTTEQAASGGAAMLALAQNSLSSDSASELTSLIPGLESLGGASSLLGNIESMSAVNDVFSKLGLDPSMVSQFAPVIMGYLTDQGASSGLLGSLTSLWQ
jgi:hypothetical protein